MMKKNKTKSTKEYTNLISNFQPLISKDHRGITLVALIITILLSYDEIRKYSNSNEFLLPINC